MKKFYETASSKSKIENAILVHKLRHGLASIKWSLKMIISGDFGEMNEEQKEIIRKGLEENEELVLLTDGLLNENGVEDKNFLNQELYDAEKIVDSAIESCKAKIKEKQIQLEFMRPPKKIEALLDKEKIGIAIQNILDNAIKCTSAGGKIVVSLNKNQDDLELKIQDFGIGIPENQKNKIFTKFFRTENAIEKDEASSGLGLFIAKNIIEAHKGKIWFDSTEGQGSTFYFTLPIKK